MILVFFAHCLTSTDSIPETILNEQIYGDVRDIITPKIFDGVDTVVQLAAISNDPMGDRFKTATNNINYQSSVNLARLAQKAGCVKNYVFASSCSVYGTVGDKPRQETDLVNPLTNYAKSKIETEKALKQEIFCEMKITCLRFATACGMSPRLRLDLVLNDFVASALTNDVITVLSDGNPWRPLIHVEDIARAIDWAIQRPVSNGGQYLIINVGSDDWNYQIKDLAYSVANEIPGTKVSINKDALPDKRSYAIDFSLFRSLATNFLPSVKLKDAIKGLRDGLLHINFADPEYLHSNLIRLKVLDNFVLNKSLSSDLYWI